MSARQVRTDTRERMLDSAAVLIRERGAAGTSVDDVLAHSGAPRGSVYYHFPGGRSQLVRESVERAGGSIGGLIRDAVDAGPIDAFDAFLESWKAQLKASDFRAGCPVLAVAIETHDEAPRLVQAARDTFRDWRGALAELLRRNGVTPAEARRLATLVIAAIEGAVVLCRVERDLQPLDDVGRELREVLRAAVR